MRWSQAPAIADIGAEIAPFVTVRSVGRGTGSSSGSIEVPLRRPLLVVTATGQGTAPRIVLAPPRGPAIDSAAPPSSAFSDADAAADTTVLAVRAPRPGRWRVTTTGDGVRTTAHTVRAITPLTATVRPATSRGHRVGRRRPTISWASRGLPATARVTI
jgi:hypothetical protein